MKPVYDIILKTYVIISYETGMHLSPGHNWIVTFKYLLKYLMIFLVWQKGMTFCFVIVICFVVWIV